MSWSVIFGGIIIMIGCAALSFLIAVKLRKR